MNYLHAAKKRVHYLFYLFVLIQTPDDMIYETNEKLSELANKYRRFFFFTKFCFAFKIVSRKED